MKKIGPSRRSMPTLIAILFVLQGCDLGGEGGDVNLAGSLVIDQSTGSAPAFVAKRSASLVATDYVVECMTYTEPPHTARSEVDSAGEFYLRMQDVGGLAIGCSLLDKASLQTVASIAFNHQGDLSAALALRGGDYEKLVVEFMADTGLATLPIGNSALAEVKPVDDAFAGRLGGTWTISGFESDFCTANPPACELPTAPLSVFIDVLSATKESNGQAMSVVALWDDYNSYATCGYTEALDDAGWVNMRSSAKQQALAAGISQASISAPFSGFMKDAVNAGYAIESLTGSQMYDVLAKRLTDTSLRYVGGNVPAWDSSKTCPTVNAIDSGSLINKALVTTGGGDTSGPVARHCLIDHLQRIVSDAAFASATTRRCFPSADGALWASEFSRWDNTGLSIADTVQPLQHNGTIRIDARTDLVSFHVTGANSGVASSFRHGSWSRWQWDSGLSRDVEQKCERIEEYTLAFYLTGNSAGKGRLSVKDYNYCEGDSAGSDSYFNVEVSLTKQ